MNVAEPTKVEEVYGGRYDGAYKVKATCPGCGGEVVHLLHYDEYGPSHRVSDCRNRCEGGYYIVRPTPGILRPRRWWDSTPGAVQDLGFNGRPDLFPKPEGVERPTFTTVTALAAGLALSGALVAGLAPLFDRRDG